MRATYPRALPSQLPLKTVHGWRLSFMALGVPGYPTRPVNVPGAANRTRSLFCSCEQPIRHQTGRNLTAFAVLIQSLFGLPSA